MLSAIAQQARLFLEAIEMDFLRLAKHTHELMKALLLSCRLLRAGCPFPQDSYGVYRHFLNKFFYCRLSSSEILILA